jgi:23S rRNA pseudouridine1911/1915/1917 synthase
VATPAPRQLAGTVAPAEAGVRLDRWLNARLPDLSRTRVQALVEAGLVRVAGRPAKASRRLKVGERVEAEVPPPPPEELAPEAVELHVIFEDDHVLVVDKPAGMVTHPGAGRSTGTLAAAALAHAPGVAGVGGPRRPGIVHRLDKGTSGLIVLAKTQAAYDALTAQLARRSVSRRYLCLVHGRVKRDAGTIDAPIGRDPRSRVRMAVVTGGKGRRSITRFRVLERFPGASYVECRLETGRTHQIRVHLASLGHPLLGDETYGRRRVSTAGGPVPAALLEGLGGVALHAAGLAFIHPASGEPVALESPLPGRMARLLDALRGGAPR